MGSLAQRVIREPGADEPWRFAGRVRRLALIYPVLCGGALAGIGLIVWQGKQFVTLTQRSNVETLTLAFFLVFFGYVAAISLPGAVGAVRLAGYALAGRMAGLAAAERRKQAALARTIGSRPEPVAGLNVLLERQGWGSQPFRVAVADEFGSLGWVEVDGARVAHRQGPHGGSNDLLAYFVHQVAGVLAGRGVPAEVMIVVWASIDDEAAAQYLGLVRFARRLETHLGAVELWPKHVLTDEDCATLERRLSEVCPAVRDESFLPDWEYQAEHKLPIIPEPLGLISLARSERRVDPVASMGCATVVVLAVVAILVLFIAFPPWVPGQ